MLVIGSVMTIAALMISWLQIHGNAQNIQILEWAYWCHFWPSGLKTRIGPCLGLMHEFLYLRFTNKPNLLKESLKVNSNSRECWQPSQNMWIICLCWLVRPNQLTSTYQLGRRFLYPKNINTTRLNYLIKSFLIIVLVDNLPKIYIETECMC